VFARLLSFKPTAANIAQWLQNPAEIDRRLAGTELASMIDASAPSQRAGVLASLSMIGEAFQLIPDRVDTKGTWSAYEWSQHRKGWLFLTSTPRNHSVQYISHPGRSWFRLRKETPKSMNVRTSTDSR
jgi:hypothetical protein